MPEPLEELQKRILALEEEKARLQKKIDEGATAAGVKAAMDEINAKISALTSRLEAAEKRGTSGPGRNDPDLDADDGPLFL